MKKRIVLVIAVLLVTTAVPVGAQSSNQTDNLLPSLPDLPGQAADVAKNVLNTIGKFFSGGVDTLNGLGNALNNLLSAQ